MPDPDKMDFSGFLNDFLNDAREGFQEINSALLALEKDHSQTERLDEVFRIFHTLKSSSTMLGFSNIADLAHCAEDLLDRLRKHQVSLDQGTMDVLFEVTDTLEVMIRDRAEGKGKQISDFGSQVSDLKDKITAQWAGTKFELRAQDSALRNPQSAIEKTHTVRVHFDRLDSLFNVVGELLITKNRIDNMLADTSKKELKAALAAMDRMVSNLQEDVSAARLVPVDEVFQKFPRMVRDLAREKHKKIELILEGHDIELDKAVLDAISEPIIHLLRNAVDHGIELPEERQKHHKPRTGTVKLSAERTENHVLIELMDDGIGIDVAHIKQAAVQKGFLTPQEAEFLQEKEVISLLFRPGFSSAKEVTGLSGRGVGLDVVKTKVKEMGGTVEVSTQKGQGTRFTLKMPLATAIMQTLMVGVGNHVFAIPSDIVLETLEVKPEYIKEARNHQVLVLRKQIIPFVKLNKVLNIPPQEGQTDLIAVIISKGDSFIGLGVDKVLDQMENIVKPFDPIAQQFKGFSGGTILGDGRVALLLDIPSLFGFESLKEEVYSV